MTHVLPGGGARCAETGGSGGPGASRRVPHCARRPPTPPPPTPRLPLRLQSHKRTAFPPGAARQVDVLRGGAFVRLPSTALVPGDIVIVSPGVLSADCVLLRGEVIVDENMLTGESVPVRKVRGWGKRGSAAWGGGGGGEVIMDENMLTGESAPVRKAMWGLERGRARACTVWLA